LKPAANFRHVGVTIKVVQSLAHGLRQVGSKFPGSGEHLFAIDANDRLLVELDAASGVVRAWALHCLHAAALRR